MTPESNCEPQSNTDIRHMGGLWEKIDYLRVKCIYNV